jgi:hypothetical protein
MNRIASNGLFYKLFFFIALINFSAISAELALVEAHYKSIKESVQALQEIPKWKKTWMAFQSPGAKLMKSDEKTPFSLPDDLEDWDALMASLLEFNQLAQQRFQNLRFLVSSKPAEGKKLMQRFSLHVIDYLNEMTKFIEGFQDTAARRNIAPLLGKAFLQKAQSQKLIDDDYAVDSVFRPNSREADAIVFLKAPQKPDLVLKIYKNYSSLEDDMACISKLESHINFIEANRNTTRQLPVVLTYSHVVNFSKLKGAAIMVKAPGHTLEYVLDHLDQYSPEEIENIFSHVGEQWAQLDNIFLQKYGKVLGHPDSYAGNLIYDPEGKQLYWIDVLAYTEYLVFSDGLKFVSPQQRPTFDCYRFLDFLCGDNVQAFIRSIQSKQLSANDAVYVEFKKRFLALRSFYREHERILPSSDLRKNTIGATRYQNWVTLIERLNASLKAAGLTEELLWE